MKSLRFAAVVALLLVGAVVAAPLYASAAARKNIDKSAILIQGADITSQGGGASFDPALIGAAIVSDAAGIYMPSIYDLMVRIDAQGKFQPGLATKWATPDSQTVIFTIR